MPHGDVLRKRLLAHVEAGGVVLGESAGHFGATQGLNATLSPMSEHATLALATGWALAGKAVVVDFLAPDALLRAADALADLRDLTRRSDASFNPTVILRLPGGAPLDPHAHVASRPDDAAHQLDLALRHGGLHILVDDSAPTTLTLPAAALDAPVVLREGHGVTIVACGLDVSAALEGGGDALIVEYRGPADLGSFIARTGRVLFMGAVPETSVAAAFWSLEAPWARLPRGSSAEQISVALTQLLGA